MDVQAAFLSGEHNDDGRAINFANGEDTQGHASAASSGNCETQRFKGHWRGRRKSEQDAPDPHAPPSIDFAEPRPFLAVGSSTFGSGSSGLTHAVSTPVHGHTGAEKCTSFSGLADGSAPERGKKSLSTARPGTGPGRSLDTAMAVVEAKTTVRRLVLDAGAHLLSVYGADAGGEATAALQELLKKPVDRLCTSLAALEKEMAMTGAAIETAAALFAEEPFGSMGAIDMHRAVAAADLRQDAVDETANAGRTHMASGALRRNGASSPTAQASPALLFAPEPRASLSPARQGRSLESAMAAADCKTALWRAVRGATAQLSDKYGAAAAAKARLQERLQKPVDDLCALLAALETEMAIAGGAIAAAAAATATRNGVRGGSNTRTSASNTNINSDGGLIGGHSSTKNCASEPCPVRVGQDQHTHVVLNCANIGHAYAAGCVLRGESLEQKTMQDGNTFSWEGVRRAVRYYQAAGLKVEGICKNRTSKLSPVPDDLKAHVTVCPVVDGTPDIDDLATIRVAMTYRCPFVDNDLYRDWIHQTDKPGADPQLRQWLLHGEGSSLKVHFIFDVLGNFIPSRPAVCTGTDGS